MSFTVDYSQASEGRIKPGKYEVLLTGWDAKETKTGTKYIELDFVVRNDIQQAHKNSHVWHKVWAKRGTTDYAIWAIITVAKAMQIPDGTSYGSLQDMLNALKGKLCAVNIVHNKDGYPEVDSFEPTAFAQNNHQFKAIGTDVAFNQDDLPF